MQTSQRHRRRGSMYVAVLGCAMMVAVIGLSALTATRVERQYAQGTGDFAQARLYAQSAIEMGFHRIANDPDWRSTYPNGVWEADQPIGQGTYTLEGIDPNDNNLKDSNDDPLVLTGIGEQGDARFNLQVTLVADIEPLSCLEASLHAGGNLDFYDGTTVLGDQIISGNDTIRGLAAATVYPDMEAFKGFAGTLSPGQQTALPAPRDMPDPDPAVVFDYYIANGTPITITTTVGGIPTIADEALGPGYNPFGGGANPLGIYVIDCSSQPLQIRNSRILGTLVLLNAGAGSAIYDSVHWEPALPNYPALLVGGSMDFVCTNKELVEATVGKTLNPNGVPYLASTDTDLDDTYPSRIGGLVYVSGNVGTDTSVLPDPYAEEVYITIDGVMVVGNTLSLTQGTADLSYQPKCLEDPPPGFSRPPRMIISSGTWRRVVD